MFKVNQKKNICIVWILVSFSISSCKQQHESKALFLFDNWRVTLLPLNHQYSQNPEPDSVKINNTPNNLLKYVIYSPGTYEFNFILPNSMIKAAYKKDTIYLHTGILDTQKSVEVYINNTLLRHEPHDPSDAYKISIQKGPINLSGFNLLKYKITRTPINYLFSYIPFIEMYGLKNLIGIDKSKFYTYNFNNTHHYIDTFIIIKNKSHIQNIQLETNIRAFTEPFKKEKLDTTISFSINSSCEKRINISLPFTLDPLYFKIVIADRKTNCFITDTFHLNYVLTR